LNAAVSATTVSESSNALELSVVNIPEDINPKRTMTLFDSGGSEIGTLKAGALILKTVTVELTAPAYGAAAYTTGTATQSGTTVTGSGTNWAAEMVGRTFDFTGGSGSSGTITGFTNATTVTVSISQTVGSGEAYTIRESSVSIKPIPVSFKKGEIITFGASQTVTLTEDAGIGSELVAGTITTGSTIVTGTSGTLRTTIKGALNLTTGTSIAADATIKGGYVKGDVVSISSFNDEPAALFVCIKDHTVFQDPRFKKEYWVEDQCSKTLNGCKMRFSDYHHLPFGGFPSIEAYRYTN